MPENGTSWNQGMMRVSQSTLPYSLYQQAKRQLNEKQDIRSKMASYAEPHYTVTTKLL
jgi:hypothetical protein